MQCVQSFGGHFPDYPFEKYYISGTEISEFGAAQFASAAKPKGEVAALAAEASGCLELRPRRMSLGMLRAWGWQCVFG